MTSNTVKRKNQRKRFQMSELSLASIQTNSGNVMPSQKSGQAKTLGRDFKRIRKNPVKNGTDNDEFLKKKCCKANAKTNGKVFKNHYRHPVSKSNFHSLFCPYNLPALGNSYLWFSLLLFD